MPKDTNPEYFALIFRLECKPERNSGFTLWSLLASILAAVAPFSKSAKIRSPRLLLLPEDEWQVLRDQRSRELSVTGYKPKSTY